MATARLKTFKTGFIGVRKIADEIGNGRLKNGTWIICPCFQSYRYMSTQWCSPQNKRLYSKKVVTDSGEDVKIGFIGAGNMAKAIGAGLIKNGVVEKSQIFVHAPSPRNLEWWREVGASWVEKHRDIAISCDIIFLAMKPENFKDSLKGLENIKSDFDHKGSTLPDKLWVSLIGGTTLKTLEKNLLNVYPNPAIIRVLPNTPMTVGHGCSVFCGNAPVTERDLDRISTILDLLGKAFEVKEELINSIATITGSGPAYFYVIIEAMADAGLKMGIPRDMSLQFAAQAMVGAGQMVLQTGRHPGALKDEVCSPGGSTIAGLHVLEQRGVRAAMIDILVEAAIKNEELGKVTSDR